MDYARVLVSLTVEDDSGEPVELSREDIEWIESDSGEPVEFEIVETGGTNREVWLVPKELLIAGVQYDVGVKSNGEPSYARETFLAVEPLSSEGLRRCDGSAGKALGRGTQRLTEGAVSFWPTWAWAGACLSRSVSEGDA